MKVLCILYDDPTAGIPSSYAIDELPKIDKYPDGATVPSPKVIDFKTGKLLGCVSGVLGLSYSLYLIFLKPQLLVQHPE